MASGFNVHAAAGYEQLMGRWSRKLAPLFIDFAGVADGEKILDVGCGTGSLTFALARAAYLGEIAAIDYSPVFVEEAIQRNSDPRIKIRQADACDLPFEDGAFDRSWRCSCFISCLRPAKRSPRCAASRERAAWLQQPCGIILAACPACA